MKKGDKVRRYIVVEKEESVATGFKDVGEAEAFIKFEFQRYYQMETMPLVRAVESNGKWEVVAVEEFRHFKDYNVNWVVGEEMGITEVDGQGSAVVNCADFTVIEEAVASYQSSVAQLTDEELRMRLEELRNRRTIPIATVKRKQVVRVTSTKEDAIMKQINMLPEADRLEVLKKMGIA